MQCLSNINTILKYVGPTVFDIFYTGPKPNLFAHEKPAATLKDAEFLSRTQFFWFINGHNNYEDFNFNWQPDIWEEHQIHIFPSQWNRNSQTYFTMKNAVDHGIVHYRDEQFVWRDPVVDNWHVADNVIRGSFPLSWHPDPLDPPYTYKFPSKWSKASGLEYQTPNSIGDKYVNDFTVRTQNNAPIYYLNFGYNVPGPGHPHKTLPVDCTPTRFVDSYLETFKRLVKKTDAEYIWITSDICDYADFDFDWEPDESQNKMLHVFPSGNQIFGDTFYMHVPTFKEQMDDLELLEWFSTVNFCSDQTVPRITYDYVSYEGDNLTQTILKHRFNSPYALFYPESKVFSYVTYDPSVWRAKDRAIHVFTESGAIVLAPKDCLQYLKTQCYDYPEIMRHKDAFLDETPLDIVFISNDETHAHRNWEHLEQITKHVSNKVHHVRGVKGRANAYKRAAEVSDTDWFFAIFAKLEVDPDFDWGWQVDRLQEPKHYIFYARNETVGINYGHASIIAYNRKLVLENKAVGLDFTLDQPHEVVPVHSGVTYYNGDIHTAWRTSFREAVKLYKNIQDGNFVEESQERLDKWCSSNGTPEGDWNAKGGNDGIAYYKEVNGDFKSLRQSYDWAWLDKRFDSLYGSH